MIRATEITEAGRFNKTHGIKGEISATIDLDVDLDDVKCIVMDIEGIYVPFFINGIRPKNSDTYLLTIDGVNDEAAAQQFTNKAIYVLNSDVPEYEIDPDGFYAADLIGYRIVDSEHGDLGEISDINDSTQNVLFVVTTDKGGEIFIPVADEFIDGIDTESRTVFTTLPSGIVDLN